MIRMHAMLRDERGFTLAELLVVTAVLGLILAGVVFAGYVAAFTLAATALTLHRDIT